MPVYEHGYRALEGERRAAGLCWLAIPKFAFMEIVNRKLFLTFLTASFIQLLLRVVYIYALVSPELLALVRIPRGQFPPVDASFFKSFLDIQIAFCVAFAFQVGAGLMARDFQNRAFILYFAKPITRLEYFIGKFSILLTVMMFATLAQGLLLYIIQFGVAPPDSPWHASFMELHLGRIPFQIAIYSLLISVTLNLMILAASCITRTALQSGILFAVMLIGLQIAASVLVELSRGDQKYLALSPLTSLVSVGYRVFGLPDETPLGAFAGWTCIAVCWLVCAMAIKIRLDLAARRGR